MMTTMMMTTMMTMMMTIMTDEDDDDDDDDDDNNDDDDDTDVDCGDEENDGDKLMLSTTHVGVVFVESGRLFVCLFVCLFVFSCSWLEQPCSTLWRKDWDRNLQKRPKRRGNFFMELSWIQ